MSDILGIVRRRWYIFLVFSFLFPLFVFLWSSRKSEIYYATCEVKVQKMQKIMRISDFVQIPASLNMEEERRIIFSYDVMRKVASSVGFEEKDIHSLQSSIRIEGEPSIGIVTIYAHSKNPDLATKVANETARSYVEKLNENFYEDIENAKRYVESAIELIDENIKASKRQLLNTMRQKGIADLQTQLRAKFNMLERIESEMYELMSKEALYKKASGDGRINLLYNDFARIFDEIDTQKNEKRKLLAKYKENSEEIKNIDSHIHELYNYLRTSMKNQIDLIQDKVKSLRKIADNINSEISKMASEWAEVEIAKYDMNLNSNLLSQAKLNMFNIELAGMSRGKIAYIINPSISANKVKMAGKWFFIVFGFATGFLFAFALSFIIENIAGKFYTPEDVKTGTKKPVIGMLPIARDVLTQINKNPFSTFSENLKTLRAYINLCLERKDFVVTSAKENEGKTTVAFNLAVAFANSGEKTILLNLDMRKPSEILREYAPKKNIFDVLSGKFTPDEIHTDLGTLYFSDFTYSGIPPSEIVSLKAFDKFLEKLKNEYNVIICDVPPVFSSETVTLMTKFDGVLLVTELGTEKRIILSALELLERMKTNLLGICINKLDEKFFRKYYYYYSG